MHITVISPALRKTVFLTTEDSHVTSVTDLQQIAYQRNLVPKDSSCFVICNGRKVDTQTSLENGQIYHIVPRMFGGKGGFGSMLRAIGAQIEKTTSREACRDLSGRRMRDINNEKKLKDWLAKEAEREKEKEERKRDRLARHLAPPQHKFDDDEYHEQRAKVHEDLEDALSKGLKRAQKQDKNGPSSSKKAKVATGSSKKEWLGLDLDSDDLTSDSDNEADPGPPSDINGQCINLPLEQSNGVKSSSDDDPTQTSGEDVAAEKGLTTSVVAETKSTEDDRPQTADSEKERSERTETASLDTDPVELDLYTSYSQLRELGLERLKNALIARGLKCGGTLNERAQRLFSVKGLSQDEIDPSLFAKSKGKGKKSR